MSNQAGPCGRPFGLMSSLLGESVVIVHQWDWGRWGRIVARGRGFFRAVRGGGGRRRRAGRVGPGPRRRRRRVHPPGGAAAPRAARALLPHARLGPRRRRCPAGGATARVAGVGARRGPPLTSPMAVLRGQPRLPPPGRPPRPASPYPRTPDTPASAVYTTTSHLPSYRC